MFMSEGCFTNKEVYRLKKIVTKLQNSYKVNGSKLAQPFGPYWLLFSLWSKFIYLFSNE